MYRIVTALISTLLWLCTPSLADDHAISLHGKVKYPPGFSHFDYVNPQAPREGNLRRHVVGTFDSFNPYVAKGVAVAGTGYLYDTLTTGSLDEPFSQYGLLAERIEVADNNRHVTFTLRKEARFADGKPVTAADVVFTFNLLIEQGAPFYAYYYGDITEVTALDKQRVRFSFKHGQNRELPLIVGQLPVLPAHYWRERDFSEVNLDPPLGSGPYQVKSVQPGRRVSYQRRADYWGKDLPVNRGLYNFAEVSFEYFLDETVALEAFKGGGYDWRLENSAKNWASGYDSPALTRGDIVLTTQQHKLPAGMQGFVMNQRRPLFQDRVLRRAIGLAMDFEWSNKNLFHNQYRRTRSYFENSEMAASGLPGKAELAILAPYREQLPEQVFTESWRPPRTDGSGRPRANLQLAQKLLREAGYKLDDKKLLTGDGKPVKFEILLDSAAFERVALPFARNLGVLGIDASVRRIDANQYQERLRKFDFDMVVAVFPQSNSPGNEQRDFWHSDAASREDSRNLIGLQDPVVDALVEALIQAPDRASLVAHARALDRVLQWGYHVVPNWHLDYFRIAHRSKLQRPAVVPPYGIQVDSWWQQP